MREILTHGKGAAEELESRLRDLQEEVLFRNSRGSSAPYELGKVSVLLAMVDLLKKMRKKSKK